MKISELKELYKKAAAKYVTPEEAEYFADEVVETEVRKSLTWKWGEGIIEDIKTWSTKTKDVEREIDLPGFTKYNFNGLGPSLKIKAIHDDLESKAKINGISMISIVNSGGLHKMHLWTQGLAKRGLFAIGAWNGGPDAVVPFNGTKGIFGTNPFTYGFPGDKGDVVIDMATSEIPYFKIVAAKKNNTKLPENSAVDDSGDVTLDPTKAFDDKGVSNLLPMGGNYKGYNINYLMEIMTSALIGTKVSSQMDDGEYIETEHGGFVIAIAIDKITDKNKYKETIKSMNDEIRSQRPKNGVDKVLVPGDRNLEKKSLAHDNMDINLDSDYIKRLVDLGS